MLIIPAIDILDGKCVRLFNGDYKRVKQYADNPVEVAIKFESDGAKYLHIVDLDGAREGVNINADIIIKITNSVNIPVQVGGGIRDINAISKYLNNGVDRVILGTSAAMDPLFLRTVLERFGSEKIIVSVDIKDGMVAINGWTDSSNLGLENFLNTIKKIGVSRIIVTDISRDGALSGPNYDLVEGIKGFKVISAGGVSCNEDLLGFKTVEGVIVGKAMYENKVKLVKNNLAKRIIPCMDVCNGRVVKGVNFTNLRDAGDAVELGKYYSESGADELIFLDITATIEGRKNLSTLVKKVSENIFIPFTVGGGIKTAEDIRELLNSGADKIAIGSEAVINPNFVKEACQRFGSQCITISLDCKKTMDSWELYINGGRLATGIDAIEFAKNMERMGAGELLINSLDRDGMKDGFDLNLLNKISAAVNLPIIASSGAGKKEDFHDAFKIVDACLAASLFHYGELTIYDLKKYLTNNFITTRK